MSLEIITGKTGEPHIDSEDIGAYNAYTIGKDSYLLNGLDMSITNVNTLHVGTGEVLFQGRHVRIKGNGEDVAIANGTTGYKRNDILCLKYQKFPQNSDIESISLELVKGTPTTGTPADPAITTGSILNGDTVVYLKLARIVVNGLTPEAPVKLLGAVKTLAETNKSLADTAQTVAQIGASVDWSSSGEWTVKKSSNGWAELFLIKTFSTEINQNFGQFNQSLGELSSRDYPFAFTSDPIVIGSVYPEGSNGHTVISALAGGGSKTKSPILTANRPAGSAIDAKLSYNWCLHVFGRWK